MVTICKPLLSCLASAWRLFIEEVCEALGSNLWKLSVQAHFPTTRENFMEKMIEMAVSWQFIWGWSTIDGCHISIQSPPGWPKVCKECHNFKSFYSVVLIAISDAKNHLIWVSVFQETRMIPSLFSPLICGTTLPKTASNHFFLKSLKVPRFTPWFWVVLLTRLERGYWKHTVMIASLTPKEGYFNYRLSRAMIVTERA